MSEENKKSSYLPYVLTLVFILVIIGGYMAYQLYFTEEEVTNTNTVAEEVEEKTEIGATFSYLEGVVEYKEPNGQWARASLNDNLFESYSVEIVGEGKAIINLDDGSAVRLNSNAGITLTSMDPNNIIITNDKGEIYSRVAKLERTYQIKAMDVVYQSLGTAFSTVNNEGEKGVEVFESSVKVIGEGNETVVAEGEKYYIEKKDKPEEVKVVKEIDQEEVKNDAFVMWNKEKDQSEKKELGFLDFKKEEENNKAEEDDTGDDTNTNSNTNTSTEETGSIVLTGSASDNGVSLSWTATGLDVSHGFKVVRSLEENPVYPGSYYVYLNKGENKSYQWELKDGKTWHFRVCQYLGSECGVYSNDIIVTAPETSSTSEISLTMSAKAESTGVGLWWTDLSSMAGFKYYKVVRSKTNADLRYPDDGYITALGKSNTSYRDKLAVNGTSYYYRICAVGDETICSNVVQITAINENDAPSAVTLSGSISADRVTLSWNKSIESDFKYYKLVWSQTEATPTYPADDYLQAISNASTVSYVDTGKKAGSARKTEVNLTQGTHYYSICVVDTAYQVTCSNTVEIKEGEVL
ncbi:MAG: FecR family protein [Patescibacteria group bacterium]|nr:FecR family protein [Patescibacteria group bacterium]